MDDGSPSVESRLEAWLGAILPGATRIGVEGQGRVDVGHSAETLLFTVHWSAGGRAERRDVVLRIRPPRPGLLEPYDLARQYRVLQGLAGTGVRAPAALWYEPTGEVIGREFYVMQRSPGVVHERGVPDHVRRDPALVRRMCESLVEQIAAIHTVDLRATGLDALGDGRDYLDRELDHWSAEIARWQGEAFPALDRLIAELRARQPAPNPTVTLVHGDCKPGNFAFEDGRVSAVFDWELATVGDPRADIGWAEILWSSPGYVTAAPGALPVERFVARWEELTGLTAEHRPWYRAFQALKMAAIMFVGGQLVDAGHSDDVRLADMAQVVHPVTQRALGDLGVDEPLPAGPILPRPERVEAVRAGSGVRRGAPMVP
ncbi:MAG: phosphotransferase family protein [Actinomycetota bacterium]|nr:phosphotransferase family protein [Actinomycetota bacterium]